jgi:hypothetical protein
VGKKITKPLPNGSPPQPLPETDSSGLSIRSNGLGRLAGGWSEEEFRDFERAVAPFERVDEPIGQTKESR